MQKIESSTNDEQSRLKQLFQVGTPTTYNKLQFVPDNSLVLKHMLHSLKSLGSGPPDTKFAKGPSLEFKVPNTSCIEDSILD